MSVPLQSVPENQASEDTPVEASTVPQAKHEAAEIVARARRQAEAIVAEARSGSMASSPLAALGDNADEIIGQVRKLIKKQRQLQAERVEMTSEIESLKSERDELVHRLTDAVERMEELAAMANTRQDQPRTLPQAPPPRPEPAVAPSRTQEPPPRQQAPEPRPQPRPEPTVAAEDTSLAARLKKAEATEAAGGEDTSLAARLKKAEEAEQNTDSRSARMAENEKNIEAAVAAERAATDYDDDPVVDNARSFYDRHSANLPRLEGDGGRSVLSAMGGMRPELETKGRKGRRRAKKG